MVSVSEGLLPYGNIEVSTFGEVDVNSPKRPDRAARVLHEAYCWRPGPLLWPEVHDGLAITFDVFTDGAGVRRFAPVGGHEVFVAFAVEAGLAISAHEQGLTAEELGRHRLQWFFYRKIRVMAEHLDREFKYSRDLYIRRSGRESDGNRSVLPDGVGLNAEGRGTRWCPRLLCENGRQLASQDGATKLTYDVVIPYGLRAAAELNPLRLDDHEKLQLMRISLFGPADATKLPPELVKEVRARTIDYFERHADDSLEEFGRSFFGDGGNVFKTIAGRQMSIAEARAAFLTIGWEAYAFVAQCIGRFVEEFRNALPTPLTPAEQHLFSHMYAPQTYLGGLSLMQLMERKDCFGPVINDLWSSPGDPHVIGVLHRILSDYAEMASDRRSADRRSKATSAGLEVAHTGLADSKAIDYGTDQDAGQGVGGYETVARILREIARRHDEKCDDCGRLLDGELCQRENITEHDRGCEIAFICPDHGRQRQETIPLEELRDVARAVDWRKEDEIAPLDWPMKWLASLRCLVDGSN